MYFPGGTLSIVKRPSASVVAYRERSMSTTVALASGARLLSESKTVPEIFPCAESAIGEMATHAERIMRRAFMEPRCWRPAFGTSNERFKTFIVSDAVVNKSTQLRHPGMQGESPRDCRRLQAAGGWRKRFDAASDIPRPA